MSLPAFALNAVRRHLSGRPGSLFATRTGNYVTRSNFVRKDWKPLLEKAEVSYRKFHTLHHTHASRLLAAGIDPAEVVKRIGDRIETLIRVYLHWIPTVKVNAIYSEEKKEPTPETQGGKKQPAKRALEGAIRRRIPPQIAVS